MNKMWFSAIAIASLTALVACGSSTSGGNTAGSGGTSAGGGGAGGTTNGGGGMGGSGTSCQQCACTDTQAMGGCADLCTKALCTGTNCGDNFCDGASALTQCSACLASTCPSANPTDPAGCM